MTTASTRAPWQVMCASIYALTMHKLEQQFIMNSSKKRWQDLLRVFFEPLGHILLWIFINLFRYDTSNMGLSIELFILLGVVPWMFTLDTGCASLCVISENRGLLFFRQIKPIDLVFAALFGELITFSLVFCSVLIGITLLDRHWHLYSPILFFSSIILYLIFMLGFNVFLACIGFFSHSLSKFFKVILRFLYLFSGIFFSAQMLPYFFRPFFFMNPLFQFIELSRESFSNSNAFSGDINYLLYCALLSSLVGLGTYMILRKKMMIEIMEH